METNHRHMNPEDAPALDASRRPGAMPEHDVRTCAYDAGSVATGLLLLWHDHWDAAHAIAQANEGERDHDLLHAIVHRREGDFSNARYWFRMTGPHPCFDSIPSLMEPLKAQDLPLFHQILPNGKWDPLSFLDAVRSGRNPDLLRAIQGREMIGFYAWLTRP